MGPETGLENAVEALRARIDELTTNWMISGPGCAPGGHLESLAAEAARSGFEETARLAASLAESLAANADAGALDETLREGLDRLRLSLDPAEQTPAAEEARDADAPQASSSFAEDTELIRDFVMESREHLDSIEGRMLELEKNPSEAETLNSVFRTFHTIKGLAGFLEFGGIQSVAHQVETLLDLARNGKKMVDSSVVDAALESADYIKADLDRIEARLGGEDAGPQADNSALLEKIARVIAGEEEAAPATPTPAPEVQAPATPATSASTLEAETPASARQQPARAEAAKPSDGGSVRVETAKLDRLLDMVGEMVIAQSLIRNNPLLSAATDDRLLGDIAQLSRNTSEVQRITMSMRMIPIGQLFQRTARLIRDLSHRAGKEIVLETSGEETEVDKTVAEELSDPLLHMVRNSVDHGVETPEERVAAGKERTARIRLKAYHQAGQIVIEISDDGRGLNREKILAKAVENGVAEPGAELSDAEVYSLIFEPGFSTADKVTDISGRGVGMDVVRRNVQKLRGHIETTSVAGQGTTFSLRLPLTLAIIDGLVVVVGSNRYIVPIFAVREMFRPTPDMLSTVQGRGEMALVRGSLLPIIRLNRCLGIEAKAANPSDGFLIIAECDGCRFCLMVDDVAGKQEVVIKSLGEAFANVAGLSGCAILGDGQIGLILDMGGIHRGGAR